MQIVIYLVLAPNVLAALNSALVAFNLLSFFAISFFVIGAFKNGIPATSSRPEPIALNRLALMGYSALGFLYIYISLYYGLNNRRLGSEYMAELYANIPFYQLVPLRMYEILQVPILFLFLKNRENYNIALISVFVLSVLIALPFSGIIDSRGKLVVTVLIIATMFPFTELRALALRSVAFSGLLAASAVAFVAANSLRMSSYARSSDYYYNDILLRLDGYNIVRELSEYKISGIFGTLDLNVFAVFVSRLPFLDAARDMKALGFTSSKQYILQSVFKSQRFDAASSMVTDMFYFGGWLLVVVGMFGLGRAAFYFDSAVSRGAIFRNRAALAAALSFALSFTIFESDFFGNIVQSVLYFALIYAFLVVATSREVSARRIHPTLAVR